MKIFLKLFTLTILIFTTANVAIASSVSWHNYSPSVFTQAKRQQKPIILFAMSDTCYWCQQMTATTFSDSAVASTINQYFYPVILHADRNRQASKQLKLVGIPSIVFFSTDGSVNGTYEGYMQADELLQRLSNMR